MPTLPLLLFDADCGFCTRCAEVVRRRLPAVEVVSIQSSDLDALGVDRARALAEMPLLRTDGAVVYGHLAWAEALRHGRWPLPWLGAALESRALRPLAAAAYFWIARNRARLPGGGASCALSDPRSVRRGSAR